MAIAHVCVQCGWDLARVRPQREPHYGLNLVHCPKCEAVSVRRRHPVTAGWRGIRRLDFALTMMAVRFACILALTFFSVLGSIATVAFLSDRPGGMTQQTAFLFVVVFYVILPLALGTFLTAGFAHVPKLKMWLGWLAWMAIVLFIVSLHGPMGNEFDPRSDADLDRGRLLKWVGQGTLWIAMPATLASAVMLVLAIPGMLVGRLLLKMHAMLMRAKWRWRRRRIRLAGAANV